MQGEYGKPVEDACHTEHGSHYERCTSTPTGAFSTPTSKFLATALTGHMTAARGPSTVPSSLRMTPLE